MKTWTHFEEARRLDSAISTNFDSYRLPEGMKRIGYDADAQVYTFQDDDGNLYKGEPGAEYGVLTPVERIAIESSRAGAFNAGML
ncbi:hypothetical protein C0992_010034 [Termitomyces sp. T32_za158]|nr:hypothetical protein C0992_010034 [Termitomyces sp. T32_za158]